MRTAVASHTVFEILNAFPAVLATDIGRRMFVAAVAGVFAEVPGGVAGHAGRVVIAIENEELVVRKACWLPRFGRVALPAVALNLSMQGVRRRLVATFASA